MSDNHSSPYIALGRERRKPGLVGAPAQATAKCERCGLVVQHGDWPFCRAGHPEDHLR